MEKTHISNAVMERLPIYLHYLKCLAPERETVSATLLARGLSLGEVQVRKDLASVVGGGKPRVGYKTTVLIEALEAVLGYGTMHNAVIIGAGKLGKALLDYEEFYHSGCHILAAFDIHSENSVTAGGKPVLSMEYLPAYVKEHHVEIGVITVPHEHAQEVCDALVACGVTTIWNFAPCKLRSQEGVFIKQENMASSLAVLISHLNH